MLAFALTLNLGVSVLPRMARAIDIDPAAARARVDESIQRVRQNMNSNPDVVQFELYEVLAKNLGDDPRILKLCEELVTKSTSPLSIRHAQGTTHMIQEQFGGKIAARAAAIFRKGGERGNIESKAEAAEYLAALGGKYQQEGSKRFALLLKKYPKGTNQIIERMIPSFGLTEQVISYYESQLKLSRNKISADAALSGLRTIAGTYAQAAGTKDKERLARAFRIGVVSQNPAVQLDAAFYLAEMGPPFDAEARKFYDKRLRESFGNGPDAEAAKWASIRILRPLIQADRSENHSLLKDAAKTNGLIKYFEENFVSQDTPGNNFNGKLAERWKVLVER